MAKIVIRHYFGDNPHFDGNTTAELKERIENHLVKHENDCWTYAGAYSYHRPVKGRDEIRQKYIMLKGEGINVRRFLIESFLEGALDDTLRLKMVCGNPKCINPEHAGYYEMEDHTAIFHPQDIQEVCGKGHAIAGDNAQRRTDGNGYKCKTCRQEYNRAEYLKNRESRIAYARAKREKVEA
jgi:hypothetical protein